MRLVYQLVGTYKIPKGRQAFVSVSILKKMTAYFKLKKKSGLGKRKKRKIEATFSATTSSGLLSTKALNTWANPPWPEQPLIKYLIPPTNITTFMPKIIAQLIYHKGTKIVFGANKITIYLMESLRNNYCSFTKFHGKGITCSKPLSYQQKGSSNFKTC